jgi:hypothetical protein
VNDSGDSISFSGVFDPTTAASGDWSLNRDAYLPEQPMRPWCPNAVRDVALAMLFPNSPLTSVTDAFHSNRRATATVSTANPVRASRRRRISVQEALCLSREILRRAETGRAATAEQDASRAIALGSDT